MRQVLKIITQIINFLLVKACSSLWYKKPVAHNKIADRTYTLGISLVGRWSKKSEMAAVKKRAIAEPWKNSKIKRFFTNLLSDSLTNKKFSIDLRNFKDEMY